MPDLRTFADDEALLREVLDAVVLEAEGEGALALHRDAIALGRRLRGGDADAADRLTALVRGLDVEGLQLLVRSLMRHFQLVNLAEDNERVRRLRARELAEAPRPRRGSLRDAIGRMAADGVDADALDRLLARALVSPVMTAHPTEARRRTTLDKLARVFAVLRRLDEQRPAADLLVAARAELGAAVQELWGSDEVRAVSPQVADEVRTGITYLTTTLADVVPQLYRELAAAITEAYPGHEVQLPALLRFGSWMGGDRDGNPFVTPAVTRETLETLRDHCLRFLHARTLRLAERVSLSTRLVAEPAALREVLQAAEEHFPDLAAALEVRNPEEPYRRVFSLVARRLRADFEGTDGGYGSPAALLEDLRRVQTALLEGGGALIAGGEVGDLARQVQVFGFTSCASTSASTRGSTGPPWPRCCARSAWRTTTRRWTRRAAWPSWNASWRRGGRWSPRTCRPSATRRGPAWSCSGRCRSCGRATTPTRCCPTWSAAPRGPRTCSRSCC